MLSLLFMIGIFVLSFGIGYLLITKVPQLLHTPLMSMTNAISAITILGALLIFSVTPSHMERIIGAVALTAATFNVVGGFVITDRMLTFFKKNRAGTETHES